MPENKFVFQSFDKKGSKKEPEENTPIRVTGIINEGQIEGKAVTVLEVHVLEILEGSE